MQKKKAELKIIINAPKAYGKTFIANVIAKALLEEGITVIGEDIDLKSNIPPREQGYDAIEIIT